MNDWGFEPDFEKFEKYSFVEKELSSAEYGVCH